MAESRKFGQYREMVRISKTKYKYVSLYTNTKKEVFYRAYISKYGYFKDFHTEREAAIAIDKFLLSKGLNPINILKKV